MPSLKLTFGNRYCHLVAKGGAFTNITKDWGETEMIEGLLGGILGGEGEKKPSRSRSAGVRGSGRH